jgi:hypothetical protein
VLPVRQPSCARILDPFLDHIKAILTYPPENLCQDLLDLVLDPSGEVTTSRVIESGHLDQAGSFAI